MTSIEPLNKLAKTRTAMMDLQNIIDSAIRIQWEINESPDVLSEEMFSKIRDLREKIINL